jgi:hypothetical protein
VVKDGENLLGGRDCAPVWKEIASSWEKFEGDLRYKRLDKPGISLIDDRTIEYLDYARLVELVNGSKLPVSVLVKILQLMGYNHQIEFLSKLNSVDPILSLEIWKKFLMEGG